MNYVGTINLKHMCVGEENWEEGIFLSRQIKRFPRIIIPTVILLITVRTGIYLVQGTIV